MTAVFLKKLLEGEIPTDEFSIFFTKLYTRTQVARACAVVAAIYLDRLVESGIQIKTDFKLKMLYLGCSIIAAKFCEDNCYTNTHWCRLTDVSLATINKIEIEILKRLNFKLWVSREELYKYCDNIKGK